MGDKKGQCRVICQDEKIQGWLELDICVIAGAKGYFMSVNFLRSKIKWLVLAFAVGITIAFGNSYAQVSMWDVIADPKPSMESMVQTQQTFDPSEVGQQVVAQVVTKLAEIVTALENNAALKGAGETISALLFVIIMAWSLVKAMMGNGFNQFIEEMIVVFLYVGIAYAMLNAGGIAAIRGFVDSIATAFAGAQMSTLEGALRTTVNSSFKAISDILSMPSASSEMSLLNPKEWIPLAIVTIVQLVGKLLTGIMVALALVVYATNIVIAFASIALAVAFAPVMVPFLIMQPTSFLFDGWLRFFLGACMMKAVGAFFMKFTNEMMTAMVSIAEKINIPADTDFLSLLNANFMVYVCCILLSLMSAYLMTMVPGLATGLVSGSASRAGFSGLNTVLGGTGLRAMNNAAQSLGKNSRLPPPPTPSPSPSKASPKPPPPVSTTAR